MRPSYEKLVFRLFPLLAGSDESSLVQVDSNKFVLAETTHGAMAPAPFQEYPHPAGCLVDLLVP